MSVTYKDSAASNSIPETKEAQRKLQKYKYRKLVYSMVNIIIITAVVLIVSVCMLVLERPTVSESEKRELAKFPSFSFNSYFSGKYMSGITEYFRDTIPLREKLLSMSEYLTKFKGIKYDNVSFHGNIEVIDEQPTETVTDVQETSLPQIAVTLPGETTVTAAQTEISSMTAETTEEPDDGETLPLNEFSHNGIAVIDKTGIMLFGGNNTQGTRYAQIINKYKEQLGPDVNVYNMVVPTSVDFYLPKKYKKYSGSEKACIENIYNNLSPDVTSIDAYSALEAHKDEYIYFRTDHHWAPLGAYYAYTAFCETLGLDCRPLEEYEHKTKQGFVGSLFGYSGDVVLKDNPDEFNYFVPPDSYTTQYYAYDTFASKGSGALLHEYVEGGNCYSMFIGADAVHCKITTEHKNGRKIAVFKESYGNAFIPYLVSNFEEIYVIDIRYFGKNAISYMQQQGVTDVLFINNIFAANTASLINCIDRLSYSYTGSIVTTTAPPETTIPQETFTDENGNAYYIVTSAPEPAETQPVIPSEQTAEQTTAPPVL